MGKFKKAVWAALGIAALASWIAYVLLPPAPRLPVYQGKTLYQWIAVLDEAAEVDPPKFEEAYAAQAAIRAIGTNALPLALENLQARLTLFDRVTGWLAKRAPFLNLQPRNVTAQNKLGVQILDILGPIATPCLPELIAGATNNSGYSEESMMAVGLGAVPAFTNLLSTTHQPETEVLIRAFTRAVRAGRIKPMEATPALPSLLAVFYSKDRSAREAAAEAIGSLHQQPEICVPLLIGELSDTSPDYVSVCIASLGKFGEAASPYADKIAALYDTGNATVRGTVCSTLARFRSKGAVAVPVLIRGLQDTDEGVRTSAALGLGEFATLPEDVIPALEKALQDPSWMVRWYSAQALGQFGPLASNAIPLLEQSCSDADKPVRSAAVIALQRIRQDPAERFVIPGPGMK